MTTQGGYIPILFARVGLRGNPSEEDYENLHALLRGKNWLQYLPGHRNTPMPRAMYQASFTAEELDLPTIAKAIKTAIESNVWTKALVLVIRQADWAQTSG